MYILNKWSTATLFCVGKDEHSICDIWSTCRSFLKWAQTQSGQTNINVVTLLTPLQSTTLALTPSLQNSSYKVDCWVGGGVASVYSTEVCIRASSWHKIQFVLRLTITLSHFYNVINPINLPKGVSNLTFHTEAVFQRWSVKKMFSEISHNSQENTCATVSFLIKWHRPATLLKKRLWHICFSFNFAKFLRTPVHRATLVAASFHTTRESWKKA